MITRAPSSTDLSTALATASRTILHRGARTTVYVADASGGRVVVKVLNDPHPSIEDLARFHRDLEITRDLGVPGVRRGLYKALVDGRHALVLEYAPGRPLEPGVLRTPRELLAFLRAASGVARVLADVHDQRVVHKDIKPQNIIVDDSTGAVALIDFGIASRLEVRAADALRPDLVEGTLAYLSPEQTGRTNRVVDGRADLYSLGATFFALLAGRPPFELEDRLELVHAHLARVPPRVDDVNPAIPRPVAEIVARLLAKDPKDRYQSARGLAHDLERCIAALERGGRIEPFPLGERDASARLRFPSRLYGREGEVAALLATFERVREGRAELALVAGDPGVGKSSLVHELDLPVAERGGVLFEGKFDQLQRGGPYTALEQAFRQLVERLLTGSDRGLAACRASLEKGLGGLGAALRPLVPTLDRLLGPLPELPQASSSEAQNRFRLAVQAFVRSIASRDRPLVLFLDDLQWADVASLDVLRWILTDPDRAHVFIIGAYRSGEVSAGHPLHELLAVLSSAGVPRRELTLPDLSEWDVAALLSDTLGAPADDVSRLASLVHAKTRGNPFFARWFLEALEEKRLVRFDGDALRWRWDIDAVASLEVTDNVVEFLAGQLQRLSDETRATVQAAACVGGRFDLTALSAAAGLPPPELQRHLWPAVGTGLLVPLGRAARLATGGEEAEDVSGWTYAFAHDRVRQAAYESLDPAARTAAHLRIGRVLLERTAGGGQGERLFDIVNHLNLAIELLADGAERHELARLNLAAGLGAAAAAAGATARHHFSTGVSLLDGGWTRDYELRLELGSGLADASYLAGALEEAEAAAEDILHNARTPLDAFRAHETRVMVAYARDRQDLVLARGLAALRQLGVRFPASPTTASIVADLLRTKVALRGRAIESLADLPAMREDRMIAAMQMIERIIPAAFRSGSKLFPLLVFRLVRLSVRHGNNPVSAFGYATYAISLCGVLGDYEGGYRFGQVGLRVAEQFGAAAFRAKALFVFGNFVQHWKEPLRHSLEPLTQSWRLGLESGAVFEAVWATFYRLLWHLQSGDELSEVDALIASMHGLLAQDAGAADAGKLLRQVVTNLTGGDPGGTNGSEPHRLRGPHYDEEAMRGRHAHATDQTHLCFYHAAKLQLCIWFGAVDEALYHAKEAERRIEAVTAMPYVPIIRFHSALAALDVARRDPAGRAGVAGGRRALHRQAAKRLRMLARWARLSPKNHRHKQLVVEAELARATGRTGVARERYDAAIAAARASGLVHEEALVLERAGAFYHDLGQSLIASALIGEAARAWRHWGAHAKVEQLRRRHPSIAASLVGGADASAAAQSTASSGTSGSVLDLASIMKAASAISGVGERLLERLVAVAVESAGASRGVLLTARDDELFLAAVHEAAGDGWQTTRRTDPLSEAAPLCDAAARLAARTLKPLVVDDARADPRFRDHAWVARGTARAVLCVPIILRQQLFGALYLENDTAGSFTADRVEVLTVLAGEAAIALENARLFDAQLRLAEAQKRFVPHEFLRSLNRLDIAEVALGDSIEKTMSVMFSDMRGFSSLVEGMTPAESIRFINSYLGEMEPAIVRHRGFVDEYQGDGILALFETLPDDAVRAALDMLEALARLNQRREAHGDPAIRIGIGITTGRLILGTIGGETHLKAGVVGDTVNLAARIESLTKTYRVPILLGGDLVATLAQPADFAIRLVDRVRVVGRTTPVELYEAFDHERPDRREAMLEMAPRWNEALALYRKRELTAARALAVECLKRVPGDGPAEILIERCERYLADPPPAEWTGVEELQRK
jgi:predicted ATPase/class 3 adenylate cyclase/tRNA A-37 threonylcarbamoyl transferase component Bud32